VAEAVVVLLEAVEVEEGERGVRRLGHDDVEVAHERAPVGQPAQAVGHRLLAGAGEQAHVLGEREAGTRDAEEQGGGRESKRSEQCHAASQMLFVTYWSI
jgi:hypothetical protein